MIKSTSQSTSFKLYTIFLSLALIAGLMPALLAFKNDPYEYFRPANRGKAAAELAEKSHYPLWKFARYQGGADLVVLGDSRARALRDKYWHELGASGAYNFAYGGGTIPEIYSTFQAIKDQPELRTLVVGVQLRSFDEKHKGGMNRVPEAVKTTANSASYVKNWLVIKKSWELFKRDNPKLIQLAERLAPQLTSNANAADLGKPGTTTVKTLLLPDVCFGCDLPQGGKVLISSRTKGLNLGLGRGSPQLLSMVNTKSAAPKLSGVFKTQVERNAKSDWKAFQFSERYFGMLEEIAQWADDHPKRQLIFVIPPTIVAMQKTISDYGLTTLDENLRLRLSKLAPVVDLDFPNDLTAEIGNFSDAYHFGPKVARAMVGEILKVAGTNADVLRLIAQKRALLNCPNRSVSKNHTNNNSAHQVFEGQACRLWKRM